MSICSVTPLFRYIVMIIGTDTERDTDRDPRFTCCNVSVVATLQSLTLLLLLLLCLSLSLHSSTDPFLPKEDGCFFGKTFLFFYTSSFLLKTALFLCFTLMVPFRSYGHPFLFPLKSCTFTERPKTCFR